MQDNQPNRVFSFVLSFLLLKFSFFPPFIPFPFLRVSSSFFVLSAVSLSVSLFFRRSLTWLSFRSFSSRNSFFRKTTRPFNRIAFPLAPSIHSFLFRRNSALLQFLRLSYSSRFFLPYPPLSALTPSRPLHPLGELYPVNRGTLLVTVCNLTEDQTKRDPTFFSTIPSTPYPTLPHPILVFLSFHPGTCICARGKHIREKVHTRVNTWEEWENEGKDKSLHRRRYGIW